jgi:hypothetical protein
MGWVLALERARANVRTAVEYHSRVPLEGFKARPERAASGDKSRRLSPRRAESDAREPKAEYLLGVRSRLCG